MDTINYKLNHNQSKTLLFMADDCLENREGKLPWAFSEPDIIEEITENTLDENGNFGEDVELEIIVKIKRK